jgi:cytochrome c oxidase cbb3-type subunit 3
MSGTDESTEIRRMEGHRPVPTGFLVFFFALIAWGAWYGYRYTPEISGWSAYKELSAAGAKGGGPSLPAAARSYVGDSAATSEGERIFETECAGCHGRELKNPTGGPDLRAALKYGADEASIVLTVTKGRPGGMPSFEGTLGPDRIRKVAAYVLHERGER